METRIKELRVKISTLENSCTISELSGDSKIVAAAEITLAWRQLQRSKMWLGKVLQSLNVATPYPESENPNSPKIEKQAEKSIDKIVWEHDDSTSRTKQLRKAIQDVVDEMTSTGYGTTVHLYYQESFLALEEAKMWLGMVLNQILENNI